MNPIYIFPFCGTGKEVLDCLDKFNLCKGFITDDENWIGKNYDGIPIYSLEKLSEIHNEELVLVHGSPNSYLKRKEITDKFKQFKKATIIHPSAQVSNRAKIGKNVLIMANVVINSDAVIEDDVIILPNSTIHHDSIILQYSIVCGNVLVAGNVKIGENCYIGAGSNVINGILVASKTMIGMGSNVLNSILKENTIVMGNPAK